METVAWWWLTGIKRWSDNATNPSWWVVARNWALIFGLFALIPIAIFGVESHLPIIPLMFFLASIAFLLAVVLVIFLSRIREDQFVGV